MQPEGLHVLIREQLETTGCASGFQLVEVVVARNEHDDELAFGVLSGQRFDSGRLGNVEECGQLGYGVHVGRGDLLHLRHIVDGRAR